MKEGAAEQETGQEAVFPLQLRPREPHWDLAFVGIMGYLVVEYLRLSAQYPILLPLQVGKLVVGVTFLGWSISHQKGKGDRSPVRGTIGEIIDAEVRPPRRIPSNNPTDLRGPQTLSFLA